METNQNTNRSGAEAARQQGQERHGTFHRLVIAGAVLLGLALLATGLSGWQSMQRLDEIFGEIDRAWSHADGVMETNIASFRTGWAVDLYSAGDVAGAQTVLRESNVLARAQLARLQEAGMADAVELATLRDQYERMFEALSTHLKDGDLDMAAVTQLVAMQRAIDAILVPMEKQGDASMERQVEKALAAVQALVTRNVAIAMGGLVLWVMLASLFARRVLAGLSRPISRISESTVMLTEAAQYQVHSAMEQAAAAIQIAGTMQELLASYRNLTERSRDMVQTSKAAADECHKGHAFLTKSQQGIGQIKVEVERISEHMRSLEEKTHQINSVLEIINEMASQTNLLSINATIEAAGAGEAGRRFAVVAEEIRLLAERAVESTEEIRALIEDIQETARVTNAVTMEGEHAVDRGLDDAARVAENFNALLTLVTQTVDAVQTIEATARDQGNAVAQVSEAVQSLTNVSTETEQHSANTLATIEALAATAGELRSLAGVPANRG